MEKCARKVKYNERWIHGKRTLFKEESRSTNSSSEDDDDLNDVGTSQVVNQELLSHVEHDTHVSYRKAEVHKDNYIKVEPKVESIETLIGEEIPDYNKFALGIQHVRQVKRPSKVETVDETSARPKKVSRRFHVESGAGDDKNEGDRDINSYTGGIIHVQPVPLPPSPAQGVRPEEGHLGLQERRLIHDVMQHIETAEQNSGPAEPSLREVLDRLITIERKLDMLMSSDPEHEDNSLDLIWPERIADHDSLEAMENRLEADETFSRTLVRCLAGLHGGKKMPAMVKAVMRRLLSNWLMSDFSGKGQKGKRPFFTRPICKVVMRAVRMATKNKEQITKVEEEIRETLKMAPNQPGGKNYERKMSLLIPPDRETETVL